MAPEKSNEQYRRSFRVSREATAAAMGSGDLPVLASPALIAFMERTAREQLDLPPAFTSVGTYLEVTHRRPSAVGAELEVLSTLISREGAKVTFEIQALNDRRQVLGTAFHRRVIVNRRDFMDRLPSSEK